MQKRAIGLSVLMASALVQVQAGGVQNTLLWHEEPFRISLGNKLLDTADHADPAAMDGDIEGHAAPVLVDIDSDGKRDLVVGGFSGQFRYYRNSGTDAGPEFSPAYSWLRAGDEVAKVPIWCCMAASPAIGDLDGDGVLDLVSGCYGSGAVYWFKGLGCGHYRERQMLTDPYGIPFYATDGGTNGGAKLTTTCSFPALVDWNDDGKQDLLIGACNGRVLTRHSMAPDAAAARAVTYLRSQPIFSPQIEVKIGPRRMMSAQHAAPYVADWDGDGLWDLLIGDYSGAVYLMRNSGAPGKPKFEAREVLLGPGFGGEQWTETDYAPRRGIRSQIQAVDYNRDGKMDLLVGDWSTTVTPRANLTGQERKKLATLRQALESLDREVGYEGDLPRNKASIYWESNTVIYKKAVAIQQQMAPYLWGYEVPVMQDGVLTGKLLNSYRRHGHVWVFLRK